MMVATVLFLVLLASIATLHVQSFALRSHTFGSWKFARSHVIEMMSTPASALCGPTVRVSNLDRSINFYSKVLGMKVLSEDKAAGVAKLALDDDPSAMSVELSATKGPVQMGDGYAGIGVRVLNAAAMFQAAAAEGGSVLLEVGDFAYAASLIPDEDEMRNTPVRFGRLADPDGYIIEVREDQKNPSARKIFKQVLNVLDIEESVAFYRDIMGMNVLRRRSNVYSVPKDASMCAYMGYNDELTGPYLELNYNYASEKLDMGNGFMQTSFKVPSSEEVANKLMDRVLQGGSKTIEVASDNTVVVRDPSEYPILLL